MAQHLKHGGSVAARTIQCPAWIRLASEVPFTLNGKNNAAADEGTMLHNCMEFIYGDGGEDASLEDLLDTATAEHNGQKLTRELLDTKLWTAVAALEALITEYNISDWKVEPFVKISDDMGGSIDFIGRSADKKTVTIVDYKFGYVNVEVVENAQAQFYALAAATDPSTSDWFGPDLETIVLAIIQPNDNGEDLQTWETNLNQIDAFETEYLKAVEKTENPEALANSGPACKFCPAEAICPVKTGEAMRATRVNEITANKLAEYLPMVEELKSWIKSVEKMAHEQLELGAPIKGYKLVAKRATRVWNQPEIVEDKIRKAKKITLEDGFEYKLKSPAQIEKVCKTLSIDYLKQYAPLCSSVSSGTTIAKDSDKRSAVIPFAGLKQLNDMNK